MINPISPDVDPLDKREKENRVTVRARCLQSKNKKRKVRRRKNQDGLRTSDLHENQIEDTGTQLTFPFRVYLPKSCD